MVVTTPSPPSCTFPCGTRGKLPRPESLIRTRAEHAAGKLPLADLRSVEDEAIGEIVVMQGRAGVGAITDGELRRTTWRDAAFEHCPGFTEER
jgi:methionine synthase II (cobalamin-independent)